VRKSGIGGYMKRAIAPVCGGIFVIVGQNIQGVSADKWVREFLGYLIETMNREITSRFVKGIDSLSRPHQTQLCSSEWNWN
jgi:hypothetical protein